MSTRDTLFNIYRKIRGVITPTLKSSQHIYEEVLARQVGPGVVWLDVGCGHKLLPDWRTQREMELVRECKRVVGLDSEFASLKSHISISLRVAGAIEKLPFADGNFNLVTANMVVEHLDRPAVQFAEVNRVLTKGGLFLLHTPNLLGYTATMSRLVPRRLTPWLVRLIEGRAERDIFRTYYRANTRRAISELAATTGFEITSFRYVVSSAEFTILPPIVFLELLWIRLLMMKGLKPLRTNIIAILKKN